MLRPALNREESFPVRGKTFPVSRETFPVTSARNSAIRGFEECAAPHSGRNRTPPGSRRPLAQAVPMREREGRGPDRSSPKTRRVMAGLVQNAQGRARRVGPPRRSPAVMHGLDPCIPVPWRRDKLRSSDWISSPYLASWMPGSRPGKTRWTCENHSTSRFHRVWVLMPVSR
jgi:hypothetical protein